MLGRVLTALGAVLGLQALYHAALRLILPRRARRFMAGDVDAMLPFYAEDAVVVFPGRNSWGPEYRGRDEIRGFLERFLRSRLQGEVKQVLLAGPPWDTTVCVRFDDSATAPSGERVYENETIIYLKVAWGKIRYERIFEDTELVADFDRWLADNEPQLIPA
jgi:ketosteroid isomerase-like protein